MKKALYWAVLFATTMMAQKTFAKNIYDEKGRLSQTNNNGHITNYYYDENTGILNMTEQLYNNQAEIVRNYDEKGNVVSEDNGAAHFEWEYEYDTDGKILSSTTYRSEGNSSPVLFSAAVYTYDGNGNETSYTDYRYIEGSTVGEYFIQSTVSRTYDESGRLITETNQSGSDQYEEHYAYDDAGKLIASYCTSSRYGYNCPKGDKGYAYMYEYDENGRLTAQLRYTQGSSSFYSSNPLNSEERLSVLTALTGQSWYANQWSGGGSMSTYYHYDDYGNLLCMSLSQNYGCSENYNPWGINTYLDPAWQQRLAEANKGALRRIYTVQEAAAVVKPERNTFRLRYR